MRNQKTAGFIFLIKISKRPIILFINPQVGFSEGLIANVEQPEMLQKFDGVPVAESPLSLEESIPSNEGVDHGVCISKQNNYFQLWE